MSYRVLANSKLTNGPATITVPFIDNRGDPRYPTTQRLSSGCEVTGSAIYSLCRGIVVYIGNDKGYTVIVQYDAQTCISYSNLKQVAVKMGQSIETGIQVGVADRTVLVELLKSNGPSLVWPVRVGAYQYYKQDPERYISGESTLPDRGASSYLSEVYPETFDYRLLSPYVITLHSDSPQVINWSKLSDIRVSGSVLYAGHLFNSAHVRQSKFICPKLPKWIEDATNAKILHGYYFPGRATNKSEAEDEIYELSYIIRNWPASLGVWVKPEFTRTTVTNDMILDVYRDKLIELGLVGAIGIYTDKSGMNKFTWADKQSDWLLWLVDRCSSVSEFDTALTPDFFRLNT